MPDSEQQQRLDVISEALAGIVRNQRMLDQRLGRIERVLRLAPLEPEPVAPPTPPPIQLDDERPIVLPEPLPETVPPPDVAPVSEPGSAAHPPAFETSVGLTLVNRIGAVTLVIGIGFFFKWAVDNQWIGPAGRVELGLLAGLLTVAAGDYLWRREQRTFAQGVTAIGSCILYLSLYAAFSFYRLVPQPIAFAGMVLATSLTGGLALRYNAIAIAALGLFGGYLTPILLNTGEDRPWPLFLYVLVLDLAALGLARERRWRALEPLSFAGTVIIYGGWYSVKPEHRVPAIVFAVLFYALYASAGVFEPVFIFLQFLTTCAVAGMLDGYQFTYFSLALVLAVAGLAISDRRAWRRAVSATVASFWIFAAIHAIPAARHPSPPFAIVIGFTAGFLLFLGWVPWRILARLQPVHASDLAMLAVNAAAYFGACYWILNPMYHAWLGLFAVAVAGIHVALGYWLWKNQPPERRDLRPVFLLLGVGLSLLTLAAPIQFTAYRITMAWTLEAAALSWIGAKLNDRRAAIASTLIFCFSLVRLVVLDAWIYPSPSAYSTLLNARFLTFLVAAICLWLAAKWISEPPELRLGFYLAGHVVALWALTQEAAGWAARSSAPSDVLSVETISVSILYALYAVLLVSLGVATRTAINRISGLVLIGVVVLKLYLFDVWQLARVYRTLAFVALGILLLSTSFLYSRFRGLIENWWKDDPQT